MESASSERIEIPLTFPDHSFHTFCTLKLLTSTEHSIILCASIAAYCSTYCIPRMARTTRFIFYHLLTFPHTIEISPSRSGGRDKKLTHETSPRPNKCLASIQLSWVDPDPFKIEISISSSYIWKQLQHPAGSTPRARRCLWSAAWFSRWHGDCPSAC